MVLEIVLSNKYFPLNRYRVLHFCILITLAKSKINLGLLVAVDCTVLRNARLQIREEKWMAGFSDFVPKHKKTYNFHFKFMHNMELAFHLYSQYNSLRLVVAMWQNKKS